jgi:hypothetical protein
MKKNSGDILKPIEIDPISGDYYIKIPGEIMNEPLGMKILRFLLL